MIRFYIFLIIKCKYSIKSWISKRHRDVSVQRLPFLYPNVLFAEITAFSRIVKILRKCCENQNIGRKISWATFRLDFWHYFWTSYYKFGINSFVLTDSTRISHKIFQNISGIKIRPKGMLYSEYGYDSGKRESDQQIKMHFSRKGISMRLSYSLLFQSLPSFWEIRRNILEFLKIVEMLFEHLTQS